ncbi:MAG: HAMP domain-containing protein [Pseudomonadaceae bacterium]|nr:HAMP domain-containing protein [Pseudomonadaceae bacterium]
METNKSLAEVPAPLVPNRRHGGRERHWFYRFLRVSVLGLGVLAVLGLPLLAVWSVYNPDMPGPAYLGLMSLNLIVIGVVVLFALRRLLVMFLDRRGRLRGGKLHVRLLGIFSILAVVPTLLVAAVAIYLLNLGIESWFSTKVNRALEGSLQVAEAYMEENERGLVLELQALSREPVLRERAWMLDSATVNDWLRGQMDERRLDALALVNEHGDIINQGNSLAVVGLSAEVLTSLQGAMAPGGATRSTQDGRVLAVVPVRQGVWMVGQRWINPAVLARVDQTNAAFSEYERLLASRTYVRLVVSLLMVLLSVVALAGAIWSGIRLANKIVRPVTALVHGTNRVSAGDLTVRLTPNDDDELGVLTQAFNRMTHQLANQRELVERKNRELDERRKQMEAVLTGVTAAVLSVDGHGTIRSANHTAKELLGVKTGSKLGRCCTPLAEVWEGFVAHPRPLAQQQVKLEDDEHGEHKTLLVRMVPQYVEGGRVGSVVMTCDDITPLIGAQRLAAWRDVARRLAHEIKNPLTPIQLSAERLKRRYLKMLPEDDQKLFGELTTTIVQQTEDMRRMTNEFSDFARMPEAVFQPENLVDMVEQVVVLQENARSKVAFETELDVPRDEAEIWCDRGQVNRVLVNVIENAVNAVEEHECQKDGQGRIKVVVKKQHPDSLQVLVLDNGKGLPADVDVNKLFDPYVTTRKKGTGLGLAIVRKVMDEHGGQVKLRRQPEGGTAVELTFARKPAPNIKEIAGHEPEPVAG